MLNDLRRSEGRIPDLREACKEAHRAEARMPFAARVSSMAAGATAPQPIVLPEPKTASGHVRPSTEIAGRADRAGADLSRGSHHLGQRAADGLPAHRRLLGGPARRLRRCGGGDQLPGHVPRHCARRGFRHGRRYPQCPIHGCRPPGSGESRCRADDAGRGRQLRHPRDRRLFADAASVAAARRCA